MKTIYFFCFGLFVSIKLNGQELKNKIHYNLNLGTSFSVPYKATIHENCNCNDSYKADYKSSFGYNASVLIDYILSRHYQLSFGIIFNQSKINVERELYDVTLWAKDIGYLKASYLTVPLLFKYEILTKLPMSVGIGPYYSYLVKSRVKGISNLRWPVTTVSYDNDYMHSSIHYKKFDFGAALQFTFIVL